MFSSLFDANPKGNIGKTASSKEQKQKQKRTCLFHGRLAKLIVGAVRKERMPRERGEVPCLLALVLPQRVVKAPSDVAQGRAGGERRDE